MLKSVAMSSFAIALGLTAWLLPMRGEQATAQSGHAMSPLAEKLAQCSRTILFRGAENFSAGSQQ